MASKNIKGITIEIGGNTTKLEDALSKVDKSVYSLNSDLKNLNQALKLDPKNTELLAQKQDVLKRNIQATTERLNTLKEAQRQMGDYSKLTDQQKEAYNRLSLEIAKGENALRSMNNELKNTNKIDFSKVTNALKKVGEVAVEVTKKMLQVTTAIAGALAGLVTAGVKSYAELEKAQKGSQRLFGDSFSIVEKNAAKAYKSMGISATKYYDQVNTYAVGLKNALNGDSKAAAKLSNDILVAQADIVAATGADADAVSNAFAAVMRGNYTMIDNLRLGIKGSKEGMQEVIDKVNAWRKANGISTMLVMGNYADMQQALVDYVKIQGIAGTAEKQLSSTIIGSVNQMKAAFDNFLNGSGSPEALSETITTVLKNISGAITKLAPSILKGVVSLIKTLIPQITKEIFNLLPQLLDSVENLIDELLKLLTDNTDKVQKAISDLLNKIILFISKNLHKVVEIITVLAVMLVNAISESLPTIIPAVLDALIKISEVLIKNLPIIIEAIGLLLTSTIEYLDEHQEELKKLIETIIINLGKLVITLIPVILKVLWQVLESIFNLIINNFGRIKELGSQLLTKFRDGINDRISSVKDKIQELVNKIKETLIQLPNKALSWGKDMVNGFINGIKSKLTDVGNTANQIANKIKSFLHFSRPDEGALREYEKWMPDFVEGLAEGIRKSSYLVEDATMDLASDIKNGLLANTSMALKSLNGSISSSLNPTINPSVAYDLNYKLMAEAMKEAMQDMGIYLDERKLGAFVDRTVSEEVFN